MHVANFAIIGKGRHFKSRPSRNAWVANIAIEWFPYTIYGKALEDHISNWKVWIKSDKFNPILRALMAFQQPFEFFFPRWEAHTKQKKCLSSYMYKTSTVRVCSVKVVNILHVI